MFFASTCFNFIYNNVSTPQKMFVCIHTTATKLRLLKKLPIKQDKSYLRINSTAEGWVDHILTLTSYACHKSYALPAPHYTISLISTEGSEKHALEVASLNFFRFSS